MIRSFVRYTSGPAFLMGCFLFFSVGAAYPRAADPGPALQVDIGSARHPISPFIYGINFANEALAMELRLPVRRWGGNATTRYNWKVNLANRGTSDVHITVSAVRTDGTVVRQVQPAGLYPLPAQQQGAKFLHQYFPELINFQGAMVVSSDPGEKVAVVALNQNQAIYTAIPVIPKKSAWQLVWSDEFTGPDGSAVDSTKWTFDTGGGGWGNNELEYYTDRTDNAHIENGMLVITAQRETYQNRSYSSSRLKTQGLFTQQYGKIEARIRLPHGQGIWPAFWMLGNDLPATPWPNCGEIDIMENIGKEPSTVHGTIHGPGYSGANGPPHRSHCPVGRSLRTISTFSPSNGVPIQFAGMWTERFTKIERPQTSPQARNGYSIIPSL